MSSLDEKILITAGVIVVRDKKILLVKRGQDKKSFPGAWTFPGGKREPGESLVDCATRECQEESGGVPSGLVPFCFYEHLGENSRTFAHLFWADSLVDEKESDTVRWSTREDLASLEIAFGYREVMERVLER